MRLLSFLHSGREGWGVVTKCGVIDMTNRFGGHFPSLRSALVARSLDNIGEEAADVQPDFALADIAFLPPIPDPQKIICLGNNYRAHVLEGGGKIPDHPAIFIRLSNTLVGHEGPLIVPRLSLQLDYEVELAVVIGKTARHIAREDALGYVAGYTCLHDASVRDIQFGHSLDAGKNFPGTAPCGPWMVTSEEIADPGKLGLSTRINGNVVQNSSTSDLIFDVPAIISYLSGITTLEPGDIIATGTPEGVGFARKPPIWLKPGDLVEIEVERIGVLRNHVVAEAAA